MTAPSSPSTSSPSVATSPAPSPIPPPVPVETHPNRGILKRPETGRDITGSGFLTPEDAYKTYSPPRLRPLSEFKSGVASLNGTLHTSQAASAAAAALRPAVASLRPPPAIPTSARLGQDKKRRSASRKRRQPGGWKKLLWIRQPYPDNYTDSETFLDHLQRNPKLRPYDFWPLVADSMVIVQHVCSVAIFICCFAGIYQDRISPVSIVVLASLATVVGWSLWDFWMGQEEQEIAAGAVENAFKTSAEGHDDCSTTGSEGSFNHVTMNGNGHFNPKPISHGLGLSLSTSNLAIQSHDRKLSNSSRHSHSVSANSLQSLSPITPLLESGYDAIPPSATSTHRIPRPPTHAETTLSPSLSPRVQSRLKTAKSALLIYFTLLGLSPILKSLTRSTSSDSIWALATWLLIINIFFFDYGGLYVPPKPRRSQNVLQKALPNGSLTDTPNLAPFYGSSGSAPPFPSSLSTNAALMASTVLASRLPSITHVFSLTVFSIEVFGLFPVFRRHLRHMSWNGHVLLTIFLVMASSMGMSIILSTSYTHTYGACGFCWGWIWHVLRRSILGMLIGGLGTSLVMGGCSWWLISLQRYKDVVIGPWDPARPVLADGSLGRGRGSSG